MRIQDTKTDQAARAEALAWLHGRLAWEDWLRRLENPEKVPATVPRGAAPLSDAA